jgi:hypothetical protein
MRFRVFAALDEIFDEIKTPVLLTFLFPQVHFPFSQAVF